MSRCAGPLNDPTIPSGLRTSLCLRTGKKRITVLALIFVFLRIFQPAGDGRYVLGETGHLFQSFKANWIELIRRERVLVNIVNRQLLRWDHEKVYDSDENGWRLYKTFSRTRKSLGTSGDWDSKELESKLTSYVEAATDIGILWTCF